MGGRLFALYGHEEILKKSSSLKPWSDLEIISHKCSLGDPLQKLVTKFRSVKKTWPPWGGGGGGGGKRIALYEHEEILKKIFSKSTGQNFE